MNAEKARGWRTLIVNQMIIALPILLAELASVNWTDHVSPQAALIIVSLINMGMRLITSTPVGGQPSDTNRGAVMHRPESDLVQTSLHGRN